MKEQEREEALNKEVELDWVKDDKKHFAYFHNSDGIIFAKTAKEAKKIAALCDAAPRMLEILKSCHIYGGGALDLERAELINKLK